MSDLSFTGTKSGKPMTVNVTLRSWVRRLGVPGMLIAALAMEAGMSKDWFIGVLDVKPSDGLDAESVAAAIQEARDRGFKV